MWVFCTPPSFSNNIGMRNYTEEEINQIYAEVMRDEAAKKLDENKLKNDYAIINKALEDEEIHPVFGKCIASFTLDEYTHILGAYGSDFFTDDESIRFHQKVRGQEFLRKV